MKINQLFNWIYYLVVLLNFYLILGPLDNKYDGLTNLNTENDPFGMGNFGSAHIQDQDLKNAFGEVDKRLMEMRVIYI